MFCRNLWSAAELTNSCRPALFRQSQSPASYGRLQFRKTFRNSRRGEQRGLEPDPLEHLQIATGPVSARSLVKPFFFTIGVSTASITVCVIWEYESVRSHAMNLYKRSDSWLRVEQQKFMSRFKNEQNSVKKWWKSLSDMEKVYYPILAANVVVFGMWRIRSLQPFMAKYFCSNPAGNAVCLPMVLSTFSHYSPLHLFVNMYVLHSFMPGALSGLSKEQFVAMYLSAGVTSSFASYFYKVLTKQPGLSLGASGAIMSVLSYVCTQYPDTRLNIIFLPMLHFAAGTGIKFIMGMDLAGAVFKWKLFDHAAHLGGALFGIAWCVWGTEYIWRNRDMFLQYYHALRTSDTRR